MAELFPLAALALPGRDPAGVVALRDGRPLMRADWLAAIDRWQAALTSPLARSVALHHDDPFEFSAALWAAWHAGLRVVVPGNRQPATVERIEAQVDLMAGQLPRGLEPVDAALPSARVALDPQRCELVLFTSGTSGEPLAIGKTLAQLQAEIEVQHALHGHAWAEVAGLQVHATVSHQHIYGLLFSLLWPLAAGRPFETRRIVYPEEMVARLAASPSLLVASPAHLKRLPDTLAWDRVRGRIRAVLSSGGPLPPESARESGERLGVAPIEIYGSSETGGVAWRQRAVHGDTWQPLPRVSWRIEDDQLELRSPFLPNGDWYRTSDRVSAVDGGFELLGRVDRIVKIEEKRVSLTAIEQALRATPWVADARTLVLPGAGAGERIAAVIVPSEAGWSRIEAEGPRSLRESLREALSAHVERVALPRRWREQLALPFNAQGKVTSAALAALFERESGLPTLHWQRRDPMAAEARLWLACGHAAFDGHFPDQPILAGVLQVDWAVAAAREAFGLRGAVMRLEALKFQKVIRPGMRLTLALEWRAQTSVLAFSWTSQAGVHGGGRAVFEETRHG
ncbi:AMP-binding protein [Caldimonas sp. KR1-144]|uniref:AMP-binding protein n=1 Tax=Caldimonas sp. KR1-144 TaxID=3400911 RepID=UPI003BFF5B51